MNQFIHFFQLKMKAMISNCQDLEKDYDHGHIAELKSLSKPPPSVVSVLCQTLILYKGLQVDKSWDNIKREIIGDVHNYTRTIRQQLECLINFSLNEE